MLQNLREHAGSWFVKVLFGVLVLSFALWGVGDIFRNYTSMRPVAKVGSYAISQDEFAASLQRMTTNMQQMAKGQLTSEQLKSLNLPQKVLDSLTDQALIREELASLKLVVTDAAVKNHIQSIPAFQNEQGKFDRQAFDYLLHHNNMTESRFVSDVRSELIQQQLFASLSAGVRLPSGYVKTLFNALEEKRVFAVVSIPFDKMVVSEKPSDADLDLYYQQNKEQFTLPEYRKVTIMLLDPTQLKASITITPDEVKEEYERRKSEFETPEKRDVKQLTFSTEDAASKAVQSLKIGKPEAVARDLGGTFKDLGVITKEDLPSVASSSVFSLDVGQVSQPIQTALGWQVFVVTKIQPAQVEPFSAVEIKLTEELRTQRINDRLFDLKNKLEDAIAGGATLAELAKEHDLSLKVIEAVDKEGLGRDEKPIFDAELKKAAIDQIFALSEGGDSPMIDLKDGRSFVVHLDGVIASTLPPFEEIRAKVANAWMESKRHEMAASIAKELSKNADSVTTLTKLAKEQKSTISTSEPISRVDAEKNVSLKKHFTPEILRQAFSSPASKAVFGETKDGFIVMMLQKVIPPSEKEIKDKETQFNLSMQDIARKDAVTLYVRSLREKYPISVNQSILESLTNRGA